MANNTILIIDYEPRSIERFRDPLIAAGFTVEIATDGISGIEAFHRLNPNMVLVEAMIPKKHGFEVCQELKRTPHGRGTPVIITTGVYKGRKYRTQALHIYGCDEYIEKPIAPAQLLEIVGKFLTLDASALSAGKAETAPVASELSDLPSVRLNIDAVAKPGPSVEHGEGDDEISARLDALLSGIGGDGPLFAASSKVVAVSAAEQDPFAQMRAELDAELDSIAIPLPFETAPILEPISESLASDQMVAPSVLEALSSPAVESEIGSVPKPSPEVPADAEEQAGQLVSFETKRRRKGKKAEKQNTKRSPQNDRAAEVREKPEVAGGPEAVGDPEVTRIPEVARFPEIARFPAVAEIAKTTPIIQAGNVAEVAATLRAAGARLPRGTVVESELEPAEGNRGMPVWAWAAVAAITLVGLYFLIPRAGSTPEGPAPSLAPPTTTAAIEPPQASPPPAPSVPTETLSRDSERSQAAPDSPKPSLIAAKVPVPKRRPDPVPSPATAPPTNLEPKTPAPAKPERAKAEPVTNVAPVPSAPTAPDASIAGVETVPDPAARPAATKIAPGALVPIDIADTMPVPLKRRTPIYSAAARQLRLSGTVTMNVLVNDRGTVDRVVLVSGVPGADLNEAAVAAAKTWTYSPATKDGIAVKVWRSEQVVYKP